MGVGGINGFSVNIVSAEWQLVQICIIFKILLKWHLTKFHKRLKYLSSKMPTTVNNLRKYKPDHNSATVSEIKLKFDVVVAESRLELCDGILDYCSFKIWSRLGLPQIIFLVD